MDENDLFEKYIKKEVKKIKNRPYSNRFQNLVVKIIYICICIYELSRYLKQINCLYTFLFNW